MTWALSTVAFFSFLHKSNLVSPTTSTFDCERYLTSRDIKFTTSSCFLRIKWSKTCQHKEGIHVVPLPRIPHSPLHPFTAIHRYFSLVPANAEDPFFCFPTATSLTPVTASFFTTTLKRLISELGLTPANYLLTVLDAVARLLRSKQGLQKICSNCKAIGDPTLINTTPHYRYVRAQR